MSAKAGSTRRAWAGRFLVPPLLLILVGAAFLPAFEAGFVRWDDDVLIKTNAERLNYRPENLRWMWDTSFGGHFHPLTWFSYAFDRMTYAEETFGYHCTNVVLHGLTVLGVYLLARRLLALAQGDPETRLHLPAVLGAAAAATVFAIHPLRVESVAWIAERRDVLSGVFYVASVLLYVRYAGYERRLCPNGALLTDPRPWWSRSWLPLSCYVASVLLCGVSLLAKASAITLPAVLLVLDVYPLRRIRVTGWSTRGDSVRALVEKVPYLFFVVPAAVRALQAQAEAGALYSLVEHGWTARLAQAAYGLVFYAVKTVLPLGLGPMHQIPRGNLWLLPAVWISAGVVALAVWLLVLYRRRVPGVAAAVAAYALVLAPVLGFAQSGPQLVADRYTYLSCVGFAVLAGWCVMAAVARLHGPRYVRARAALILGIVGLVFALYQSTLAQAEHWRDPLKLWLRAVNVHPESSIAHVKLGDAMSEHAMTIPVEGRQAYLVAAASHYVVGMELEPRDAIAAGHLGRVLTLLREDLAAIEAYERALMLDPRRSQDRLQLAQLLVDHGRPHDAANLVRSGLAGIPSDTGMLDFLAQLLSTHPDESVRNPAESVRLATRLNEAFPGGNPFALLTLSTALAADGQYEAAVSAGEAAQALFSPQRLPRLAAELERRLTLFRAGRPYWYVGEGSAAAGVPEAGGVGVTDAGAGAVPEAGAGSLSGAGVSAPVPGGPTDPTDAPLDAPAGELKP